MSDYDEGWYYLCNKNEPEHSLVKCYINPDTNTKGFGFGIWDGGGFIPINDLKEDTIAIPVTIIESSSITSEQDPLKCPECGMNLKQKHLGEICQNCGWCIHDE